MLIYTISGILLALWFISVEYQDCKDDYYIIGYEQILLCMFIIIAGPASLIALFMFLMMLIVSSFVADITRLLSPIKIKLKKKIQEDDV